MAIRFEDYYHIDIRDYDAVVAGAGLSGAVAAQRLAEQGNLRVLVLEKSHHVAGCLYDEEDEHGIRVNRFGPHVFHTNDQRVFTYFTRFCDWHVYEHRVLADWYGTYFPIPVNENSLDIMLGPEHARLVIARLEEAFGKGSSPTLHQLMLSSEPSINHLGTFLYENVFEQYSKKQWGSEFDTLDTQELFARVPIRLSRDDRYYDCLYQGVPSDGYTATITRMLSDERITVCLGVEAESAFGMEFAGIEAHAPLVGIEIKNQLFTGPIVCSSPLDELFLQRFGRLPYRTVDFEYVTRDGAFELPCGTVNYTVTQDFTRATESKRITGQASNVTTVVREYPRDYTNPSTQIPYYPVLNDDTRALHQVYRDLVKPLPNFVALGRLAEYRYYDMGELIARALDACNGLCAVYGHNAGIRKGSIS